MRSFALLWLVVLLPLANAAARGPLPADGAAVIATEQLPPEARQTLALIRAGGPFPYDKDGSVFGNYEHRLPARPRGTYREYTVPTPGARNRGVRRLIAGDGRYWYTDDHYRSFREVRP